MGTRGTEFWVAKVKTLSLKQQESQVGGEEIQAAASTHDQAGPWKDCEMPFGLKGGG